MPSLSAVLRVLVLGLPALASAEATMGMLGFDLTVRKDTEICKDANDWNADFAAIKNYTEASAIRILASSECDVLNTIFPVLEKFNYKIVLGIWPTPKEKYIAEVAALKKYLPKFYKQVISVSVGSEHLYRGDLKPNELASYVQDVKKEVADMGLKIPVGFADTWNKIGDTSADPVVKATDLSYINAFPYWQKMDIQNGTRSFVDDIVRASQHLQDTRGLSYQYAVGETNWPSGGADYGNAVPSIKNMETYFQKAICGVLRWNVDIFVHSPFDEPTKAAEGGDNVEQHWGLMTSDRKPKFNLRCNQ